MTNHDSGTEDSTAFASRFVDKYRPKVLDDVVGHDRVVESLKGMAASGKLRGNTILLSGPHGLGKTSIARVIARTVACEEQGEVPCEKCMSCKRPLEAHADIMEVNAASTRGIDDARNLIEASKMRPRFAGKTFILDEAHQLTAQAAQSLLKVFEEPPPYTTWVLCTTEPYSILKTIRSRSSWYKLEPVATNILAKFLAKVAKKEGLPAYKEVLYSIAEVEDGHVRDALRTLEQVYSKVAPEDKEGALAYVPEAKDQIKVVSVRQVLDKYLKSLVVGDGKALVYARKVEHPEALLTQSCAFLMEAGLAEKQPGLVTNRGAHAFIRQVTIEQIARAHASHLDCLIKIRNGAPAQAVLDSMILSWMAKK